MATVRQHIVVRGRVQGVGFRFFTRSAARRHGLRGWVRNCADGTVELEAQGEAAELQALVAELHRAPPPAVVRGLALSHRDLVAGEDAFNVRF